MYDIISKKTNKFYIVDKNLKINKKSVKIEKNKDYVPKDQRPKWCRTKNKKKIPQFKCFCYGKNDKRCPFFAFCNADKKDYISFFKKYSSE